MSISLDPTQEAVNVVEDMEESMLCNWEHIVSYLGFHIKVI